MLKKLLPSYLSDNQTAAYSSHMHHKFCRESVLVTLPKQLHSSIILHIKIQIAESQLRSSQLQKKAFIKTAPK
jgi:hypothetical protein